MPYLEISLPSTTVESSISIALGTVTSGISASVLTLRFRNDDGTVNTSATGASYNTVIYQQGVGGVIFGNVTTVSVSVTSGVGTASPITVYVIITSFYIWVVVFSFVITH